MASRGAIVLLVISIIVIGGFVGFFIVVPAISPPVTGMSVTLYDSNGNAIWEENSQGSIDFWIGDTSGAEVASAVITVTYNIQSSEQKTISNPSASGSIQVTECYGNLDVNIASVDLDVPLEAKSTLSGTYTYTLDLTTFLPGQASTSSIEYGWKVKFVAHIDASGNVDGNYMTADWTSAPIIFQFYWNEGAPPSAGTITVDGTLGISVN